MCTAVYETDELVPRLGSHLQYLIRCVQTFPHAKPHWGPHIFGLELLSLQSVSWVSCLNHLITDTYTLIHREGRVPVTLEESCGPLF